MNVFDNLTGAAHIVAESSRLIATNGGAHIADLVMHEDRDNGTIVGRAAATSTTTMQAFASKDAVAGEPMYLLLTPPFGYNSDRKEYQQEKYFYNKSGEIARAYELKPEDIFTVSADAITAVSTTPVVGQYVYFDNTTGKYIETAATPSAAADYLCYCQIIEKVIGKSTTSYRLMVLDLTKTVSATVSAG